jgi:hypothetical protein
LPVAAGEAAVELAERSRLQIATPASRRRPFWRRPTIAAGVLGGCILLTAGTSLAAYQLSIPPFQTIPAGIQRLTNPVPVDYVSIDGTRMRCLAFAEFQNLSPEQYHRLDHFVAGHDWSGFGARLVQNGPAADARTHAEESDAVTTLLDTALYRQASQIVPGLLLRHTAPGHPTYAGYGESCNEGGR